ncbi:MULTISPECIES: YihY/virulence factor BrkB family protein [Sphingobacterium]|jgi:membrane protein|uniref:Ribonuclease BN n=1 Tax=Sphingobacterium multivorum TaxID=28454 RepID=A0A2X2K466_SPHMU|nr:MULTISPECIES: YihY/virulence factor BrkB family protein [Sphingobacterium]HAE69047.1 YihY/virulence factor BrkB family protein [Sphingobacterium sp.]OFV20809.1 ribonuclease BN [Sphingobacterium sp. HMSC13C05]OJZ01141.1 MAG: ribonuclease BN [Sphingobacterium sp. 40-24]QQT46007.1 YihY/virulence factor BrkB family protein [Sphingobacterium multivorum]QQT61354.1 YihY/virulence factor BrkB family protein [Sphingobacterium multivorum]
MDKRTKSRSKVKTYWRILKSTVAGFLNEDSMKYSASLSYYTVFSIGPILVLMIALAGIFYGEDAIEGKVFLELRGLVGSNAAKQIQEVIQNLQLSGKSNLALLISSITLVLGATTVFGDIQNSINKIWHVRAKPKKGWLKLIQDRLLSSSLVIGLGFLLVVTLIVNGVILALTDQLQHYFPDVTVMLMDGINFALSFGIIFLLFSVIFKALPDVNIHWRTVRAGALFTSILFVLGRYLIGVYLEHSATQDTYGAAGSFVLILLWVYYTAAILYFGAIYTREYATVMGIPIEPSQYAVHVETQEIERNVTEIPPAPLTQEEQTITEEDTTIPKKA